MEIKEIFSDTAKKIVKVVFCYMLVVGPSVGQLQEGSDQLTLQFKDNDWNLSGAPQLLEAQQIKSGEITKLANQLLIHQKNNTESLGLAVTTDRGNELSIRPSNTVRANEITISKFALDVISGKLSSNSEIDKIVQTLAGERGVYASYFDIIGRVPQPGDIQTVDPFEPSITQPKIDDLRNQQCVSSPKSCGTGIPIQQKQFAQLGNALNQIKKASPQLKKCSDARREFRKFERMENLGKKNHEELVRTSEVFDRECLSTFDDEVLMEHFAVLKSDDNAIPYCGAYRIGPTQFLTAMHCFQDQGTGRRNSKLIRKAGVYLASKPASKISLDSSKSIKVPDRSSLSDERKSVPTMLDFLILDVLPFDQVKKADFQSNFGSPMIGEPITLMGYFRYHTGFASTAAADWINGVRVTKSIAGNYCRVYDRAVDSGGNGCLIHRCQSFRAFSGSPIFQKNEAGKNVIVGIHRGDYKKRSVQDCPVPFEVTRELDQKANIQVSQ